MISQNITKLIGEAMKAHDEIRLSTLRMLSSEFNYEKIKLQHDLTESDEQNVIRKEARKRKDAIEIYEKLKDSKTQNLKTIENLENEKKELEILQEFLPPELTDEQVNQLIDQVINKLKETDPSASLRTSMGKVITDVKSKAPGIDGSKVAEIVKQKLS